MAPAGECLYRAACQVISGSLFWESVDSAWDKALAVAVPSRVIFN